MAHKYAVLRETILYIEENYMNDISLSDIIAAVDVNSSTLTELLKSETGMTAVQRCRMELSWRTDEI